MSCLSLYRVKKMSEDTTTIRVEKDLRDTLKERRAYPKEKLSDVIEREIGESTQEPEFETVATQDDIRRLVGRIDDLETDLTTQIERLQK